MKTNHNITTRPAYVPLAQARARGIETDYRSLVKALEVRKQAPVPQPAQTHREFTGRLPENHIQAWQEFEAEQAAIKSEQMQEMHLTRFWDLRGAKAHKAKLAAGHDATLAERRRRREQEEAAIAKKHEREHRRAVGHYYACKAESMGLPFGSIEEAFARVHHAMDDEQEQERKMAEVINSIREAREEKASYQEAMYANIRRLVPALPEVPYGAFVAGVMPYIAAIAIEKAEAADVTPDAVAGMVERMVARPAEVKQQDERTARLVESARRLRESEQYWGEDERVERDGFHRTRRGTGRATRLRARSSSALKEQLTKLGLKRKLRWHEMNLENDIRTELQRRGEEFVATSLINN